MNSTRTAIAALVLACGLTACGQPTSIGVGHSAGIGCSSDGQVHASASDYGDGQYSLNGAPPVNFHGGFSLTLSGASTQHLVVTADDWPTFDQSAGPCVQPTTTTEATTTPPPSSTTTTTICPDCTPGTQAGPPPTSTSTTTTAPPVPGTQAAPTSSTTSTTASSSTSPPPPPATGMGPATTTSTTSLPQPTTPPVAQPTSPPAGLPVTR